LALAFIALILFVKAAAGVFRFAIHLQMHFLGPSFRAGEKSEKIFPIR
jgi:hypothetical protein